MSRNTVSDLLKKGQRHQMAGRLDEAERAYRRALRKRPICGMTWNGLGTVLEAKNLKKQALTAYEKAVKVKDAYPQALYNIGRLKQISGDFNGALSAYQNLLKIMPDFGPAWADLGNLLREMGELKDGLMCLEKGASLCPDRPSVLNNLGVALDESGDTQGALASFRKAADLAPDYISPMFNMAQIFHRQGDHARAEALYRKVLRLNPKDKKAGFLLQCIKGENVPTSAPAEYVSHLFDSCAPNFEDTLVKKLGYRTPELLYRAISPYLKNGMSILDLGCGTGLGSGFYRPHAEYLAGMDISSRMLSLAESKGTYHDLCLRDINRPWNLAGKFDLIYSCDCFVYMGDLFPVISQAAQHLNPEGLLAFSVERLDGDANDENFRLLPSGRYAHSRAYLEKLLKEAGFHILFMKEAVIRKEEAEPVQGLLSGARRIQAPKSDQAGPKTPASREQSRADRYIYPGNYGPGQRARS